jgi:hypothetical protein
MSRFLSAFAEKFPVKDLNPVLPDCQAVLFSCPGQGKVTLFLKKAT